MTTVLSLTNKEAGLLNQILSDVSDLDMNENYEEEYDNNEFDSLWDKVVDL